MGKGNGGHFAVERWTIRLAPAFGMAAIASSALVMTEPEARWAQLFTGPTDQSGQLSWRVAVKRGTFERQQPDVAQLRLAAVFGDRSEIVREFPVDSDGVAWVNFERPASVVQGPVAITLSEGSHVLASGSVFVAKQRWLAGQRNEGGWCTGHHEGSFDIKVGVVDGVVLHALASPVVVALSKNGQALSRQPFAVQTDGAHIVGIAERNQIELLTDDRGIGHLSIRSTDMAATVTVTSSNESRFVGALPIRAGGLRIVRHDTTLVVTSPVGHEQATVGLLTDNGLVDVRTVRLKRSGDTTTATLNYTHWPAPPLWAMVSAEPDLDAGNTIGWPILDSREESEAHSSRVVPNLLALDGYRTVTQRLERQRHRAWITSSAALFSVALLIAWAILRSNRRNQMQMATLNRSIEDVNPQGVSDRTPYALIAVVVLTAAVVALAWWTAIGFS